MRKYIVELDNLNQKFESSTDENVTELGLLLQIWQDLKKLETMDSGLQDEDKLIQKILSQILVDELGGEDKIIYPDYYVREATNLNVDAKEE